MYTSLLRFLSGKASRFRRDEDGNFAVTTAVCAMALMLCGGVAVDYSRMAAAKTAVDGALDAALLAAGKEAASTSKTEAQLRSGFEDFFFSNLDLRGIDPSRIVIDDFTADRQKGSVSARVRTNFDLAFMGLAGLPTTDIRSVSEASFSNTKVELAMMLDVTGSMNDNGKIAALRLAAASAIDILLPEKVTDEKMRISLVPYSVSVNAGPYAAAATGSPLNRFVTERWGSQRFTDASPAAAGFPAAAAYGPQQAVTPLSGDPVALKSTVASLTGSGGTAGHLGVAWSYYTLSPEWKKVWPAASRPSNYKAKDVQKIALLMTDGEFNTIYAPFGERWDSASFAVELCRSMKRDGIIIYSIAFDAPAAAQRTLQACATPGTAGQAFYYSARSASELQGAFQQIATDIRKLRLSK